jgi:hypothetical protein
MGESILLRLRVVLALDSEERLVLAYGTDSLQDQLVSWLGWPTDTCLQWIWQDG